MNRAMLSNNFPWIWANYHIFQSWIKVPTKHETTVAFPMFPISMAWKTSFHASLEQFHHLFNFFHGVFSGFEDFLYLLPILPFTNRLASPGLGFATKKIPVSDRKQKFSLKISGINPRHLMPGASSTPLATSTPKGRTPLTNSSVAVTAWNEKKPVRR